MLWIFLTLDSIYATLDDKINTCHPKSVGQQQAPSREFWEYIVRVLDSLASSKVLFDG